MSVVIVIAEEEEEEEEEEDRDRGLAEERNNERSKKEGSFASCLEVFFQVLAMASDAAARQRHEVAQLCIAREWSKAIKILTSLLSLQPDSVDLLW